MKIVLIIGLILAASPVIGIILYCIYSLLSDIVLNFIDNIKYIYHVNKTINEEGISILISNNDIKKYGEAKTQIICSFICMTFILGCIILISAIIYMSCNY